MSHTTLRVHSIETLGTHEGPGIRLVVFLQGCHFRCLYCHNPDTWALGGGSEMTIDELLEKLEHERPYFGDEGGLTVSGGEPTIQRVALRELFAEAQARGIHTALDTNGAFLDDDTKKLLDVTNLVLLDVKHINPAIHQQLTKASNTTTLAFAEYCREHHIPMWLRYVLVPGYTDQPEFLEEWAKRFEQYENVERVEILPYHTFGAYKYEHMGLKYGLEGVKPPTNEEVQIAKNIFEEHFKKVVIR